MKLYIASTDKLTRLPGLELISPQRRCRLEKYMKQEDRQRCLAAGLLLRHALGERVRDIVSGPKGKPYIPGGPCFNISHSGEYVVLGMSGYELGLDIEALGQYRDMLARRCCTDEEYIWLQEQNPEIFYKLWTGKESIMKATGLGFALPAGSFSLLPLSDGLHTVNEQSWYMKWLDILPGYALCAAMSEDENIEAVRLSAEELLV